LRIRFCADNVILRFFALVITDDEFVLFYLWQMEQVIGGMKGFVMA